MDRFRRTGNGGDLKLHFRGKVLMRRHGGGLQNVAPVGLRESPLHVWDSFALKPLHHSVDDVLDLELPLESAAEVFARSHFDRKSVFFSTSFALKARDGLRYIFALPVESSGEAAEGLLQCPQLAAERIDAFRSLGAAAFGNGAVFFRVEPSRPSRST